jgi:hypothetical protein
LAKKSGLDIISKHKKIRQVLFCDWRSDFENDGKI